MREKELGLSWSSNGVGLNHVRVELGQTSRSDV